MRGVYSVDSADLLIPALLAYHLLTCIIYSTIYNHIIKVPKYINTSIHISNVCIYNYIICNICMCMHMLKE